MKKPELKQFGDITPMDLEKHPVWIACHTADCGEPWYDETDEETFRPRTGDLPADPSEGMLLVRATAVLEDGSRLAAFLTPAFEAGDLGTLQPHVFIKGRLFSFWGGVLGVAPEQRASFYAAVERRADQVFPIRVAADEGLTNGISSADVEGFCKMAGDALEVTR